MPCGEGDREREHFLTDLCVTAKLTGVYHMSHTNTYIYIHTYSEAGRGECKPMSRARSTTMSACLLVSLFLHKTGHTARQQEEEEEEKEAKKRRRENEFPVNIHLNVYKVEREREQRDGMQWRSR